MANSKSAQHGLKVRVLRASRQLHRLLLWTALIAMIAFVLSALCHPLMVWTGPQAAAFYPPATQVPSGALVRLQTILNTYEGAPIRVGKVVPSADGPLLQVTHGSATPRDYYALNAAMSGDALPNYDEKQALWLARYYSGSDAEVASITFVDQFSKEYPRVNRLLPVYKVVLETDDQLTLYVHTETNALASISNRWKMSLQTVFQLFHTWSWLDGLPLVRVILVSLFLSVLMVTAVSGGMMLLFIRPRQSRHNARSLHRKLAWIALIPFIGLVFSGFYHLLQAQYGELPSGMRLSAPLVSETYPVVPGGVVAELSDYRVNSISLFPHRDHFLMRASVAVDDAGPVMGGHQQRNARFSGRAAEQRAIWLNLNQDGAETTPVNDEALVREIAADYLGLNSADTLSVSIATHFGPDYDFRNKRLPVFLVRAPAGDVLAIDPQTGILVEHTQPAQKLERLSFSLLHKWNLVVPLAGREVRDGLVVAFLVLLLSLSVLGIYARR